MKPKFFLSSLIALLCSGCVTTESFVSRDKNGYRPQYTKNVQGQFHKPEGQGPFPTVIILQSCGGNTPTLTDFWPKQLASMGYASFVIDSLGARGARYCDRMYTRYLGLWDMADDAYSALDHLKKKPEVAPNRFAVMGFSLGAMAINQEILSSTKPREAGEFNGAISFYGLCERLTGAYPWRPVLEITAEHDTRHHPSCAALANKPNITVVTYSDTYHAFDDQKNYVMSKDVGGNNMLYSERATQQSVMAVQNFLRQIFQGTKN
jgi:dienelactone hydrolase